MKDDKELGAAFVLLFGRAASMLLGAGLVGGVWWSTRVTDDANPFVFAGAGVGAFLLILLALVDAEQIKLRSLPREQQQSPRADEERES